MNDLATQLASLATMSNLLGVGLDLALILITFVLGRAAYRRAARLLPAEGVVARWLEELEPLSKRVGAWTLAATLLCDLGFNLWLIGQRRDLTATKRSLLSTTFERHREELMLDLGFIVAAVVLNLVALQIVTRLLRRVCAWVQGVDAIEGNDESIAGTFERARWGIERASWISLLAIAASRSSLLPPTVPAALFVGLRVFAIYALARISWSSLEIVVTTLEGLAKRAAERREKLEYYDTLEPLFPTLRRALEAAIMVVGFALAAAQLQPFEALAGWGVIGMQIVGILFVAQVLSTLFEFALRELLINQVDAEAKEKQRRLTVLPMVASIAKYVFFGFAIVMSLSQVGINPLPVLAGAGIAGVAIGFGAQSLITDLVCGIFILWENYFIVGDFVTIGDQEGFVDSISLRVTRLRDEEGRVHIIPNGKIEAIVNYSKDYVAAEVGVGVSYETDLDEVYAALEEVGEWVGREVEDALEPSEIEGIEEFSDFAVVIKLSTKVKPGTHVLTQRIVRKRIKEVFDRRGIEIAYPRRVIDFRGVGSRELLEALGRGKGL